MPDCITSSSLKLYADDSLIYHPITNPSDQTKLQNDLDSIQAWADRSQMKFNISKCEQMRISRNTTQVPPVTYTMDNSQLKYVTEIKYLGVTIDNSLSFSDHITHVCRKGTKTLYMLMRSLKKARRKTRYLSYVTICRPILEYSSHIWSPHKRKLIDRLESINRKAFRWVYGFRKYDSISNAMLARNWHTLATRRNLIAKNLLNRIADGKAAVDPRRSLPLFSNTHNTRHGSIQSGVNTNVARFAYKHRMLSNNVF